jgi:hypothetical protein
LINIWKKRDRRQPWLVKIASNGKMSRHQELYAKPTRGIRGKQAGWEIQIETSTQLAFTPQFGLGEKHLSRQMIISIEFHQGSRILSLKVPC